jgi:hypothetical protein
MERPVADPVKTFTEDEVAAQVEEKLAAAKAEGDKAFQKLWDEAKQAKALAKKFEGLDPDEIRTLKQRFTELEQQKKAEKAGITSEQLDKMRLEIRADLEREYSPVKARVESLSTENRTLKLDNVVKGVMAKNGVRAERVDALYRLTAHDYDLTDDGQPMVKGRLGTPVDKYVLEDLSKAYPEFYQGSGSSGGGASKSNAGGAGGVRVIAAPVGGRFGKDFDPEALSKGTAIIE